MLASLLPWRTIRDRQRAFVAQRQGVGQDDASFVMQSAPDASEKRRTLILLIRTIMARFCNCHSSTITAKDSTSDLTKIMGESTLFAWFVSLGDQGPDEDFFNVIEAEASRAFGHRVQIGSSLRNNAIKRWISGESFGSWSSWLTGELFD
jgi:hypothetical protein